MNYEAWRISYQSSEQAARAAFKAWQAATEQGAGNPVAWQTEIHAYDPPAICTHGSLRSAKAYQEGAGIDPCCIVPLYRHPPKPIGDDSQ